MALHPLARQSVVGVAHPVVTPWPALAALLGAGLPVSAPAAVVPDGFGDVLVADTLDVPVGMAFLPDGRLLVVEQNTARIRVVRGPGEPVRTVGTVPGVNTQGVERGLLGIAVDPLWLERPYVYVHYTAIGSPTTVHLSRFRLDGDLAGTGNGALTLDVESRYDLIADAPDQAFNHNGGTVRFGADGMLYASLGEDATVCAAQDTVSLRGVILRLDVIALPPGAGSAARTLITPGDNPFVGSANANARLVWAFGLRNPFRFQIDRIDGVLYISDVGESTWEELDRAAQGGIDFGWPLREGPVAQLPSCPGGPVPALRDPIFSYARAASGHRAASIITAGAYRPPPGATQAYPAAYAGDVFASDYYGGHLWRIHGSGDSWQIAAPVPGQPSSDHWGEGFDLVADYAIGPDGALWYVRQAASLDYPPTSGQVRRVLAQPGPASVAPPLVTLGAVSPLPARAGVRLDFALSAEARVELTIHDVGGERIRCLMPSQTSGAGTVSVAWDGRDDAARRAPSGLYFARLLADGTVYSRRIVLAR